jgi:hypothetical protein
VVDDLDFTPTRRVRPAPAGCPGILVAHLAAAPKPYVYVGRAMPGIPASPLGNPFRPAPGVDAIESFRQWLREAWAEVAKKGDHARQAQWEAVKELKRLAAEYRETGRLTLACWCAPDDCHADVIADAVAGMVARETTADPPLLDVPGLGECLAFFDRAAADGLPWVVYHGGRVVRVCASLALAREPLARRAVVLGAGGSVALAAMGMGKCDSCGEVKPGIEHKGICADCQAWQPRAA